MLMEASVVATYLMLLYEMLHAGKLWSYRRSWTRKSEASQMA